MYTGIVDHKAEIISLTMNQKAQRLRVATQFEDLIQGESIALDGICLTVAHHCSGFFECDLSCETLNKTIARQYQLGQWVNLERSLKFNGRLGGHWMTGHVDTTAKVLSVIEEGGFKILEVGGFSKEEMRYLIPKGSIGVNGVSLTVNEVNPTSVSVTLIPQTLALTNLSNLSKGLRVNIEWDMFVKVVAQQVMIQWGKKR